MRAFIVVSDHPFFSITGADGSFEIAQVPAAKLKLVTWHSQYGRKELEVETTDGESVEIDITYLASDRPPPENLDELARQ